MSDEQRQPETTDWDRECVKCGHKWRHDGAIECPKCERTQMTKWITVTGPGGEPVEIPDDRVETRPVPALRTMPDTPPMSKTETRHDRAYYSSVSQRDDGLWYFIGRDGQTHGPFASECEAIEVERAQWEQVK